MVSGGVVSGESSEGVSVTPHHSPLHHSPSHLVILSRTRSTPVGTTATPTDWKQSLEQKAVNTIRTLSMDAVQAANSGHPGTPIAMAPVAYCLWQRFLRFDPADPIWPNRDRFVLSMGHASMLLYSLLHLTGVKAVNAKYERLGEPTVKLDDIKR